MGLDTEDRGYLENLIDEEISQIPETMAWARSENFRKECNLEKEEDFSLGYALGSIMKDFAIYYPGKHGRFGVEEIKQSSEILTKRIREIKEAIFKCG